MTLIIILLGLTVLYIHVGLSRTSQKANTPLQLQSPAKTNGNLGKLIGFKGLSLCSLDDHGAAVHMFNPHKLLVIL